MSIVYRFINKISSLDLEHYRHDTVSRFLFHKDEITLIFSFLPEDKEAFKVEIFSDATSITLEWDKAKVFCNDVVKVTNNIFGKKAPPRVPIEIDRVSDNVVSLFLRREFGFIGLGVSDEYWEDCIGLIRLFIDETKQLRRLVESYREFDLYAKSLQNILTEAINEEDKNKKGRLLEQLIRIMVEQDGRLKVYRNDVNTESEEIDLVIENQNTDSIFVQLQSPFILVEYRNWSSRIGAKEIRDFAQKIQNRPRMMCRVGCVVTTSILTEDANKELIGYRGKDFLICIIDNRDFEYMISKSIRFSEILQEKIKEASLK